MINLLVAQLACAYGAAYDDMIGWARLARGRMHVCVGQLYDCGGPTSANYQITHVDKHCIRAGGAPSELLCRRSGEGRRVAQGGIILISFLSLSGQSSSKGIFSPFGLLYIARSREDRNQRKLLRKVGSAYRKDPMHC